MLALHRLVKRGEFDLREHLLRLREGGPRRELGGPRICATSV
jgi:hypothetical protein